ncbi:MAG TPA: hypothetical protein VII58_06875 [Acidobacteriaceae bacterium]
MTDNPTEKPADLVPKPAPVRRTGLSPKEQKLQALRDKLASAKSGKTAAHGDSGGSFSAKNSIARKTAFQRKAT